MMAAKAPMSGLRVVDFTTMIAGPYCTRLFADCGAEVIKIESPTGDHIRHIAPFSGNTSMYFAHLNCGKKSVVVDLKNADKRADILDLIKSADVVVENFRPGVMKRLGLDYTAIASVNPNLVYCSISGFGQSGPRAEEPAYAPIIQAASGYELANMSYQDHAGKPDRCGIFTADILAAVYAFGAVQTALLSRERFGGGQFIDVALMDAMINLLVYECQSAQNPDHKPRMLYSPTRARNGFVIVTPITQKNFEEMADAMEHKEWKDDARFRTDADRRENWSILLDAIESWTSERAAKECEKILTKAGVPCSRYRTISEAINDSQSQSRGLMQKVQTTKEDFFVPNPPFKFSEEQVGIKTNVPSLGEHTKVFLKDGDTVKGNGARFGLSDS
jgi:CoA:oxalate CoA-transferase